MGDFVGPEEARDTVKDAMDLYAKHFEATGKE